jgi:hypothetical protein
MILGYFSIVPVLISFDIFYDLSFVFFNVETYRRILLNYLLTAYYNKLTYMIISNNTSIICFISYIYIYINLHKLCSITFPFINIFLFYSIIIK